MNLHPEIVISEEAYEYILDIIHTLREEVEDQQFVADSPVEIDGMDLGAWVAVDALLRRLRRDLTDTARLVEYHRMKTVELTEQATNKDKE